MEPSDHTVFGQSSVGIDEVQVDTLLREGRTSLMTHHPPSPLSLCQSQCDRVAWDGALAV